MSNTPRRHPLHVFLKRPKQTWRSYSKEMAITIPFVYAKVRTYGIKYYLNAAYHKNIKNHLHNKKAKEVYGSGYLKRRKEIKARLIRRDGAWCQICRLKFAFEQLTIDHIKPRRNEGSNNLGNLQLLCRPCHEKKDVFLHQGYRKWGNFPFKEAMNKISLELK